MKLSSHRFDEEAFYTRLDRERRKRRISFRDVSRETGVPSSFFTRIGRGGSLHADNLVTLMAWLGETDIAPYLVERRAAAIVREYDLA